MVRILEHELKFLDGTIDDYWRIVSSGLKRGYPESLTHLVLDCEQANASPIVYITRDSMMLMYVTKTDIFVRYVDSDDLAVFCFTQLEANPHFTYHFNLLPSDAAKKLEQMLKDDFKERAIKEFHKQREKAGIPESSMSVFISFIDLHNYMTFEGGMTGMAHYLASKNVMSPEILLKLQAVGQKFRTSSLVHIYHDLTEFDPELRGKDYEKLRNAVSRAKRSNIIIERYDGSQLAAFNGLVDRWNQATLKRKAVGTFQEVTYTKKIATNLEYSPETEIYVARVEGSNEIVAAAGVGVYGESAFMDFRHQDFTVKGSMEYLEYAVMCQLKARGVRTLSRGRVFIENVDEDKLFAYKAKFDPLEKEARTNYTVSIFSDERITGWVEHFLSVMARAAKGKKDFMEYIGTQLAGALTATMTAVSAADNAAKTPEMIYGSK